MNELQKLRFELRGLHGFHCLVALIDPSTLGLINFRISAWLYQIELTRVFYYFYWPIWRLISTMVGIEISGHTSIGAGLNIIHFGGIFLNAKTIIGENCTIYNGVTIGSKGYGGDGGAPVLGNNINIGVGAKILGEIMIGDDINIGAMTVITKSFPEGGITIVGNPARVLHK